MTAAEIATGFGGRRNGAGFLCRCPVPGHGRGRGDRNPSLSLRDGVIGLIELGSERAASIRDIQARPRLPHMPAPTALAMRHAAAMVEHGWAVAFRKYSLAYVAAEESARAAKRGIWAGTFTMPEEWRRTNGTWMT